MAGKSVYIGIQEEEEDKVDTKDDGLEEIWKEMSMAMECSKDVSEDPLPKEKVEADDNCDHSFIFKDDLGDVCRICGLIGRGIETIFEYRYKVKRSRRSSESDSWNTKGKSDVLGINVAEDDVVEIDNSAHPRPVKQMKAHPGG